MVDVFISYKREDRDAAEALANRLALRGHDVWWDAELMAGDAFITEIHQVLKRAKAVVVLWSEEAMMSRFVVGEALAAFNRNAYLGAMLEPELELPPPFNAAHAHALHAWQDDASAYDDLIAALELRTGQGRRAGQRSEEARADAFASAADDVMFWRGVADSDEPGDFEAYLNRFGEDGLFVEIARARIRQLTKRRPSFARAVVDAIAGKPAPPIPEVVAIPAGAFLMGSPEGAPMIDPDETPQRRVAIETAFAFGARPVSFAEYDPFCEATGRKKAADQSWGRGARPVINVTWRDASAYCAWLTERTGNRWRLPSEAEWEYAARAGGDSAYFWGDVWDAARANGGVTVTGTTEPGRYPANAFGLFDMAGNVWEWCADDWHDSYRGAPADGRTWLYDGSRLDEEGTGDASWSVIRGGSWDDHPHALRSTTRGWWPKDEAAPRLGFRVVKEL